MSPATLALWFALGCFTLALAMSLWRLLRGPEPGDRLAALYAMAMNLVALTALLSILFRTPLLVELALLYAVFAVAAVIAFARRGAE